MESYQDELIQCLNDPQEAAAYLEAALEPTELDLLPMILKNILEAHPQEDQLSQRIQQHYERLEKLWGDRDMEAITTLIALLNELGFQLSVNVKR